ncbi:MULTISPECIES: LysR substrate-binding domain-containing protein [unclassified Brachybacterium]|uniref:LysR substrate-binding domain-containing protein n=1 Tax=unclassified Brachybacterium TaxID=2623841 RepID=UPI0036131491
METRTLRVGYVPGVEPDRFLRRWKSARREAWLELAPVPFSRQHEALQGGEVDMCFVRLPIPADDLHVVALWEERPAVVVGTENVLSLLDEVHEADLADETEILPQDPDDAADRVAVVATGIGYTRMPLSLARLHHRKDAAHRPLADAEPTRIALVWPRASDDELRQEFVGVVRGRTPRSGRGSDAADSKRSIDPKSSGDGKRSGERGRSSGGGRSGGARAAGSSRSGRPARSNRTTRPGR